MEKLFKVQFENFVEDTMGILGKKEKKEEKDEEPSYSKDYRPALTKTVKQNIWYVDYKFATTSKKVMDKFRDFIDDVEKNYQKDYEFDTLTVGGGTSEMKVEIEEEKTSQLDDVKLMEMINKAISDGQKTEESTGA